MIYFRPRCIGFARRRVGRGGRIILDRASTSYDDIWARLDYTILETNSDCVESRLAEVVETKRFDGVNIETCADDEKLQTQPSSMLNNHHNNNIVIKSENSKNQEISDDQMEVDRSSGDMNNQKLDDFEQLLDSANASSNIINKKLVCRNNSEISEDSFLVKSIASQSDALNKTLSVGLLNSQGSEASSSGVSSTNGSLLNSVTDSLQTEVNKPVLTIDEEDEDELLKNSEPSEDFYMSLMEEIKNEWLHFRPKTPPYSSDDVLFDSDIMDKSKKFAVELQMLEGDYQQTDISSYVSRYDSAYLTQPMACNFAKKSIVLSDDLVLESTSIKTEPADNEDELMDTNDDLSAKQTVEQEAVRKLLEKYQNDVADGDRTIDIDIENFNFDDCITDNEPIGCSKFNISACELIGNIKSEAPKQTGNKLDDTVVIKSEISEISSEILQDVTKEAPIAELQSHNYVLQYGPPVTSNMTLGSISNNIITCSPSVEGGISPATTLFQQQFINSGNAIISTAQQSQGNKLLYDSNTIVLATPTRKQLNGPTDRNCKFP